MFNIGFAGQAFTQSLATAKVKCPLARIQVQF